MLGSYVVVGLIYCSQKEENYDVSKSYNQNTETRAIAIQGESSCTLAGHSWMRILYNPM